ncbi:bifunctional histidinol-phosphatase/imidazoleglycerol-phosphate dehydratase HisB [Niabella beijingensis]|uniref:bifunctional histidinol-phosphatase/imidazoleglycerol-phosphate dehydratase HisB n=1 Tax=Niabella beijingensis TaxID=2872700 RepID=UPI001CBBFA7D|nr:bifunctional histidinol-phosphatase/imidazoleglycerol-phosphate dehydratase HisB [Niabella beijingensis]MBZ4190962.1 bifunctional histidinol-phosphatase/imidazoleglycerol-phosphate dehydratase HisB [Niabella beijingensis]
MKKVLFIDRDGTLIYEAPPTYQLDSIDKVTFYPGMFTWLGKIAKEMDFELVMVTNQDGLGTEQFPEATFWPTQHLVMRNLEADGIRFSEVFIDKTYPEENAPTRKPGTGMLTKYISNPDYDLAGSYVIGDRITDIQLAKNLGCKGIWLAQDEALGAAEISDTVKDLESTIALKTTSWQDIYALLQLKTRVVEHERNTNETKIKISINLDGTGQCSINTGLGFFDHMLHQLGRHSGMDLGIVTNGDLHIDEHHTIEDTAIALGEALGLALGNKAGIERYGFCLPMDDALVQVALDFGGRPWLVWDASFKRERIGEMPTEMFYHFFKSLSDAAKMNLNIKAEGENEHHKIEAIFKALAKAVKMAIKRTPGNDQLPSTKGML